MSEAIFQTGDIGELVKSFRNALAKGPTPSITTGTGLNFLPLEEEARNTYPVFHPVLDMIPRVTPEELGHEVGGLVATWKQIVSPGGNVLPSVPEGSRNAYISIPSVTTSASFVTLGIDAAVSFEAQSAGVGFNDNLGSANLAKLNTLLNLEERMAIFGNSGDAAAGNNGFLLGAPAAPVIALATGGTIASGTHVSVYVVPLTGWGVYNAAQFGAKLSAPGVAQQISYTSADGNTVTLNGGTGLVSPASNVVTTTGSTLAVTVTVDAIPGAFGYAVFVDSTDATTPSKANAFFAGVFTTSVFTVLALPSDANQAASALTATDYSANPATAYTTGDFDGIATWLAGSQGGSRPAYWKDLAGASLTSDGAGGIVEIERAIANQWNTYQVTPDALLISSDVMPAFQQAMQQSPSGSGAGTLWVRTGDPNKPGMGGSLIEEYKCKFSAYGLSKVLPIRNIPWLPSNTVLAPTFNNPYPAAGDTIPSNFRMVCREGYYGLKFPYTSRVHSMGIYVEEALECYVPWAGILLNSVGNTYSA
jgi:hypothetical protein